jgi:hypothetical protein
MLLSKKIPPTDLARLLRFLLAVTAIVVSLPRVDSRQRTPGHRRFATVLDSA